MSFVCQSNVLVCHLYVTRVYLYIMIFHLHILVRHPYVTHIYSHVIGVSLVCSRLSFVCQLYVLVCHPYVTRIYSYVILCHSYLLVCHVYVTRMYSNVIRMFRVCGFTMNHEPLGGVLKWQKIPVMDFSFQKSCKLKACNITRHALILTAFCSDS